MGIPTGIHTSYVVHICYEFSLDMDVYSLYTCIAHVP